MVAVIEKRCCLRCRHEWWPNRPGRPGLCPKCKTPYHDIPKPNGKQQPKTAQG